MRRCGGARSVCGRGILVPPFPRAFVPPKQSCYLEHDGDTGGAIVGGEDGFMPVGLIRIVISPGTAVPVGTDEDAVFEIRTIAGDDVRGTEHRAVVAFEQRLLGGDGEAVTRELTDDPLGTGVVSGAVHRTRAKGTLLFAVKKSAVSTEGRAYGLNRDGNIIRGGLFAETTRSEKRCAK